LRKIFLSFEACSDCQEGCESWPEEEACSKGCDHADFLRDIGYYQYEEPVVGECTQSDIPRFLFAVPAIKTMSSSVLTAQLYATAVLPDKVPICLVHLI